MARKPLLLKDYLELEWNSDSSGAGFHCAPRRAEDAAATVRFLLEEELRGGGGGFRNQLPRAVSMRALKKISALFNAVGLIPFAGLEGVSSRSFWKRGKREEKRVKVKDDIVRSKSFQESKDIDEQRSFEFLPPVVSSGSSCSESSIASDLFPSSITSSVDPSNTISARDDIKDSASSSPIRHPSGGNSAGDNSGAITAIHCPEAIEKEQLSPVSVTDFPSEEEDEDDDKEDETSSPSFHHSLAKLERTKLQLLQKIRRFECLAHLEPVDLDHHFASSDRDEHTETSVNEHYLSSQKEAADEASRERRAWRLIAEINASCRVVLQGSVEKLLVDFFAQGLRCSRDDRFRPSVWQREPAEQPLLEAARDWVQGTGCGQLDDFHGDTTLREMERKGQWGWSAEAEDEVATEVERLLLESLTEELVADLMYWRERIDQSPA